MNEILITDTGIFYNYFLQTKGVRLNDVFPKKHVPKRLKKIINFIPNKMEIVK